MSDIINSNEFSVNEREGEFEVRFRVSGYITMTINAQNEEEAKAKAYDMIEDEEFGLELDEADDVGVSSVRKHPRMYRVLRNGKAMQSSYLLAGDRPREPDKYGF